MIVNLGSVLEYQVNATDIDTGDILAVNFAIVEGLTEDSSAIITPANFYYNDTDINNLYAGTITITYENFAPYVSLALADRDSLEDFEDIIIDLDGHFSDNNNDELDYSVSGYDTSLLAISVTDNIMTISSLLNQYGSTEVTVTAEDTYSDTVSDVFTITIGAVNDVPVISLPDTISFAEDNTFVVDFTPYVSDVDEDELSLDYSNNADITVSIDGFDVTFSAAANWNGSELITFTVDDGQSRVTGSDDVVVQVTAVNDAPEITAYDPVDLESSFPLDTEETFSITVTDIDTDPGNLNYSWFIDDVPQLETSNSFTYTFDNNGYFEVKAEVDDGEFSDEVIWTVFVYVGSATLAESEITINNKTVSHGGDFNFNVLTSYIDNVWDVTSFSFDLSFNSSLVDYSSILGGTIISGGSLSVTDNGNSITVNYSGGDVVGGGELVNLTFSALEPGSTALTLSNFIYEGESITGLTNGTLTIVNDAPVLDTALLDYEEDEDFYDFTITLGNYFSDPNGDNLSYSADYDTTEIAIVINFGVMTVSSLNDWYGLSTVTVTAEDEYEATVSDAFTIEVSSLNDEPELVFPIEDMEKPEDFGEFTIDLDTVFDDIEDNELSYGYNLLSGQVGLEISDNILTISSVFNWYGEAEIEVTATDDDGASVTDNFIITVIADNDAPAIDLPESFSYLESNTLNVDFSEYVSDIDSETLT